MRKAKEEVFHKKARTPKEKALRVALYLYRADRHSCGEPDCDAFDLLLRI